MQEVSEDFWIDAETNSAALLKNGIKLEDDGIANQAWFIHKITKSRLGFIRCFKKLKAENYYKVWCDLEQIELALAWLQNNPFYDPSAFGVDELAELITTWQRSFPYTIFFSPEYTTKDRTCSICGESADPWSACPHEARRVYCGRECVRIVKKAELLAISLVRNPVQKYSVGFLADDAGNKGDHHDYSMVKFVVDRIALSFDRWRSEWTKAYHPHTLFGHVPTDAACPCESGRKYSDCCLRERGVLRPHLQILFEKPPPQDIPNAFFAGYGIHNGPAELLPEVRTSET